MLLLMLDEAEEKVCRFLLFEKNELRVMSLLMNTLSYHSWKSHRTPVFCAKMNDLSSRELPSIKIIKL